MDIQRYYEIAKAEIEPHIRRSETNFKPDRPFYLKESVFFREEEPVRISIHHPIWARDPLKQPHSHDFFEMTFVCEGSFKQIIDGEKILQTKDQIVLVRPDAWHSVWIEKETDVVFNILMRKSVVRDAILRIISPRNFFYSFFFQGAYDVKKRKNYLVIHHTSRLTEMLQQIIQEYFDKKKEYQQTILFLLLLLFTECSRIVETEGETEGSEDILPRILDHIEKHFLTATLKSVADHFGYSTRQLARILKKEMDRSFTSLVNECKIRFICMELQATDLPLKALAEKMGFCDVNYFYKVFRREKGISFSEYKAGSQ